MTENCSLKKVVQESGKVASVDTTLGPVNCEFFVNCAGFWARGIGQMSEPYVKVPLHAVEHYYLHTKPVPGLDPMTPGQNQIFKYCVYFICYSSGARSGWTRLFSGKQRSLIGWRI